MLETIRKGCVFVMGLSVEGVGIHQFGEWRGTMREVGFAEGLGGAGHCPGVQVGARGNKRNARTRGTRGRGVDVGVHNWTRGKKWRAPVEVGHAGEGE